MHILSKLKFKIKLFYIKFYFFILSFTKKNNKEPNQFNYSDLHCFVINLTERIDRWDNVIKNFNFFPNVIFHKFNVSKYKPVRKNE